MMLKKRFTKYLHLSYISISLYYLVSTEFPRSIVNFYMVFCYIKMDKTFWLYGITAQNSKLIIFKTLKKKCTKFHLMTFILKNVISFIFCQEWNKNLQETEVIYITLQKTDYSFILLRQCILI